MGPSLKTALREKARGLVPLAPETRKLKSQRLVELVREHDAFGEARQIAIFYPRECEVDLLGLWSLAKKRCYFPKADPKGGMQFFRVSSLSDMAEGYAKIPEPLTSQRFAALPWRAADLVLVPGLLFDPWGGRIGSGKGYYDRFLSSIKAQKWGVCFSEQLSKSKLAQDSTDVRMDALVTDLGWRLVKAR